MTGRLLIASAAVLAGAVAAVSGADSWVSKPYNTWTDVELKKVLEDSPWASKAGVTYANAKGGSSAAIEDVALVSWVSGLPLRQAALRQQLGASPAPSKEMETVLATPIGAYMVSVKVSGGGSSGSYATNTQRMMADTFLLRDGKSPILATGVEGRALDKDGKVIETPAPRGGGAPPGAAPGGASAPAGRSQQMQILPIAAQGRGGGGGFGGGGAAGGQGGGNRSRAVAAVIVYVFPKTGAIAAEDKEVEFVTKLCGPSFGGFGGGGGGGAAPADSCTLNVKKKFKLKDMIYNGELAL